MRIGDWTLKEVAQGRPWAHPTHAMFVHFPTAFYPAALLFGLFSLTERSQGASDAATALIALGILATVPAALTGLLDRSGMVAGSTKKRVATGHMLYQLGALLFALVGLVSFVAAGDRPAPALGLLALGAAVVTTVAGNWLGGVLVYRMGMRVGGSRTPASPRRTTTETTDLVGEPR